MNKRNVYIVIFSFIICLFLSCILVSSEVFGISLIQDYTTDHKDKFEGEKYLNDMTSHTAIFCNGHGKPFFNKRIGTIEISGYVGKNKITPFKISGGKDYYEFKSPKKCVIWKVNHGDCDNITDFKLNMKATSFSGMSLTSIKKACDPYEEKDITSKNMKEKKIYSTGITQFTVTQSHTDINNYIAYLLAEAEANSKGLMPSQSQANWAWWRRNEADSVAPTKEVIKDLEFEWAGPVDGDGEKIDEERKEKIEEALKEAQSRYEKEIYLKEERKEEIEEELKSLDPKQDEVLQDLIDALTVAIDDLNDKITNNETIINNNKNDIVNKRKEQNLVKSEIDAEGKKQRIWQNEINKKNTSKQREISKGNMTRVAELEDEIKGLEDQINNSSNTVNSKIADFNNLQADINNLIAINENKRNENSENILERDALSTKLREYQNIKAGPSYAERKKDLEEELERIDEAIKKFQEKINAIKSELSKLGGSSSGGVDYEKISSIIGGDIDGSTAVSNDPENQSSYSANGKIHEAYIFDQMHKYLETNGSGKIDYKKTIVDHTNIDEVKVIYNAEDKKYTVGPFNIEYLEVYANNNQFAGITGDPVLKIKIDDKDYESKPLSEGGWKFAYKEEVNGELVDIDEDDRKNTGTLRRYSSTKEEW